MRLISPGDRFQTGLTMTLVLAGGLGIGPAAATLAPVHAAQITSSSSSTSAAASSATSSLGDRLALLSSEVAALRASKLGITTSTTPVPTTVSVSDSLFPASLTDALTNSKTLKDFGSLFTIKSGKLVNWDQQTLDNLENDVGIKSPQHVAPSLTTTKGVNEAQVINASSSTAGGTVQPAPVPEPGSLLIFTLALGGALLRARLGRARASA